MTYDSFGRRTRMTYPEGNYAQLTYDARGNITELRRVAKLGTAIADIGETGPLAQLVARLERTKYWALTRAARRDR